MNWLKRQLITFARIFNTGLRNLFRNAWLTTAATAIMIVTLSIVLFAVAINMSLGDTIDDITKDVTLSIYLKDDISEQDKDRLRNRLISNDNVRLVTYRSKEEALKVFQARNEGNEAIIKGLSIIDNKLPASFEVSLYDLTLYSDIQNVAEAEEFASAVDGTSADQNEERRKSIDRIAGAQDFVIRASILAGSIFAVLSVLVIFNTIRMAVFTRSYEIEIMKLIGATPGYIRGPFLVEASLYGLIAGCTAFAIVYTTITQLGPKVDTHINVSGTLEFFETYWAIILLSLIIMGILIGFLSSSFAMFKYLRLKKW